MISFLTFFSSNLFSTERRYYKFDGFGVEEYILLDGDVVDVFNNNEENFIYLAVQPHSITGHLYANITWRDQTNSTVEFRQNDLLQIDCNSIRFRYDYRGGVSIMVWSIPKSLCSSYVVFSANQRSAFISYNETSKIKHDSICWLLSFKKAPSVTTNVYQISEDSSLKIYDEAMFVQNKPISFKDTTPKALTFWSTKKNLISYRSDSSLNSQRTTATNFTISLVSDIPFGDWTDTHRLFQRLTKENVILRQNQTLDDFMNNFYDEQEMYITEFRRVENWIWGIFFTIGGIIFGITVIVFFIRPVNKMRSSLSLHEIAKDLKND